MKKITSISIVIVFYYYSFSQVDTFSKQPVPHDYTYFMEKSRGQKTAAWVLLGGGVAMTVIGSVVYSNAYNRNWEEDPWGTALTMGMNTDPTGAIIATAGVLVAAGSIPLFIASGKNKKNALSISTALKMENMPAVQRASVFNRSYPAVSIKLAL